MTNENRTVIDAYYRFLATGNRDGLLFDDAFIFKSPVETFLSSTKFINVYSSLIHVVQGVSVIKQFYEEHDVCTIYNYHTNAPAGTLLCFEWIKVSNGKIKEVLVVYDAAKLRKHKQVSKK